MVVHDGLGPCRILDADQPGGIVLEQNHVMTRIGSDSIRCRCGRCRVGSRGCRLFVSVPPWLQAANGIKSKANAIATRSRFMVRSLRCPTDWIGSSTL